MQFKSALSWLLAGSVLVACSGERAISEGNPGDGSIDDLDAAVAPADASDGASPTDAPSDAGELADCGGGHCAWLTVLAFGSQSCALREDEGLWCWGAGGDGPARVELAADAIRSLSGGAGDNACLVDREGALWCVEEARFIPVGGVRDFEQVATAYEQSCALRSAGRVSCWTNDRGFPSSTPGLDVVPGTEQLAARSVAASDERACLLDDSGAIHCWRMLESETADGGVARQMGEVFVLDAEQRFVQIAMSGFGLCAIREDGALLCWSEASLDSTGATTPSPLAPGRAFAQLALSSRHGCAVAQDGSLWCWGEGDSGQLGLGETSSSSAPTRVGDASDWKTVSVAHSHSCALNKANEVWCWGGNYSGAIGRITHGVVLEPRRLAPDVTFRDLAFTYEGGCGVSSAGELWCWGLDDSLPLPAGTAIEPSRIGPFDDWTHVYLHYSLGCGLRGAGEAYCWGLDNGGALGGISVSEPTALQPALRFTSLSLSQATICGLTTEGTLFCWGSNAHYEFGQLEPSSSTSAVSVTPERKYKSVALGGSEGTYGIDRSGTLWGWPRLFLFEQTFTNAGSGYEQVWVSQWADHFCALKDDGSLACWGSNSAGELGLGHAESVEGGMEVASDQTFASASVSGQASCALNLVGDVYCWGRRYPLSSREFELKHLKPTHVLAGHQFAKIAVSGSGACALDHDGALYCWGDNSGGAMGATQVEFRTPTRVPLP